MDRRKLLATSTVAFAGLAAGKVFAQDGKPGQHSQHLDAMHQKCLELCQNCESLCNQIIDHCLRPHSDNGKIHAECARAAMTCQDFCGLSAKLMSRMDKLSPDLCKLCAQSCDACAVECEKIKDDPQMKACAKLCRECSEACKKMAESKHH
jgi:Domain of Unknown Function (DUF326)